MEHITREEAYDLLKKYNKDPFHIQHALTVEAVMKWYTEELGFGADAEYWGIVGLLHDIDFELYPEEHCIKAPELLREGGVGEDIIHGVVSHGYGITVDVAPEHEMEKVLFAADELTGLIWAAALMRPSKSTKDMELKSLKKKYKSKGFAAGCSREVIERGAEQLGWELDKLLTMTLEAMKATEDEINADIDRLISLKLEIMNTIWQVTDENAQMVLERRYHRFKSWEDIAADMRVSIRWVHKIHAKALDDVEKILEKRQQSASEFT